MRRLLIPPVLTVVLAACASSTGGPGPAPTAAAPMADSAQARRWVAALETPPVRECWFGGTVGTVTEPVGEDTAAEGAPPLTSRERTLMATEIAPLILREHREEALAADLAETPMARAPELLELAIARFDDVLDQPSYWEHPCRSPGPAPADPEIARRIAARRALELVQREVQSEGGTWECATGWPDFLLEWPRWALPQAAVAAGVDPEAVRQRVWSAAPELHRFPLVPSRPIRD